MTSPASPQPGNQDERACACGHPIGVHMPEEIPAGPGERRCWATGPCDCTRYAAAAAEQPGAGGAADEVRPVRHRDVAGVLWVPIEHEPAPSAGQDTERRCGRCGQIPYVHGLPDSTCVYEPTEAAGQDTERLRDEESIDLTPGVVWSDAQLDVIRTLTAQLHKTGLERDEAVAKVQRVEALADERTGHGGWIDAQSIHRALGSS